MIRIQLIIVMIWWTGLAPWEFEFSFPGSLTSPFLTLSLLLLSAAPQRRRPSPAFREQLLHRNVQRFRGGLVFKAHRPCVPLNSRLESNKEEEFGDCGDGLGFGAAGSGLGVWGLGFGGWGVVCGVWGSVLRVSGWFQVSGFGLVEGARLV